MPPIKITKKDYLSKPEDYRGTVAGQPYLVYMGDDGKTTYGPVEFIPDPYGSECKHETVINGRCANCQRKVR